MLCLFLLVSPPTGRRNAENICFDVEGVIETFDRSNAMCENCEIVETQLHEAIARCKECGELLRLSEETCRLRCLVSRMMDELPQDHEPVSEAVSLI